MFTRFLTAVIVSGALLVGCAEDGAKPQVVERSDFSRRYVSVVLPQGVDFDFPFELISERLYTRDDNGDTRRGLMLEFSDRRPNQVADEVKSAFAGEGYVTSGSDTVRPDGRVSFSLAKKGARGVFVEVQPAGNRTMETPGAQGTVWLSWRVRDGSPDLRTSDEE